MTISTKPNDKRGIDLAPVPVDERRRYGGSGKYAPKLTLEERCGYYFALKEGASIAAVSAASGLELSVVLRLSDDKYKAYGVVRGLYAEFGHDEFGRRFYTNAIKAKLVDAEQMLAAGAELPTKLKFDRLRERAAKLEAEAAHLRNEADRLEAEARAPNEGQL